MNTGIENLKQLVRISRNAGEKILEIYNSREVLNVQVKGDGSPLTLADEASNACITQALQKAFPEIPIVSEEEELPSFAVRRKWKHFWLVDPLDGTKEFLKRNGEFTTNIALIEGEQPVMGVVFAPAKALLFAASKSEGSFKIQGETWTKLISAPKNPREGVRIVESRSHGTELPQELLDLWNITERVASGSSLKICLLADGRADIYPRLAPTMEWDVAAGDCIFRYSGENKARFSPLTYNKESLRNESFILGIDEEFWNANHKTKP